MTMIALGICDITETTICCRPLFFFCQAGALFHVDRNAYERRGRR
jgi:hypothetical protein